MDRSNSKDKMSQEGRALLTESEREVLSGEKDVKDNYRYKVESLLRQRITKDAKLAKDVNILRENSPEIFRGLQEVVCDE